MRIDNFHYPPPVLSVYTARLGPLWFAALAIIMFASIPTFAHTLGANFHILVLNTTTALPFWLAGIGCALLFEAYVSRLFFICCAAAVQWLLWQPTRTDIYGKMSIETLASNSIEGGGGVLLLALTVYAFSKR